MASEKQIKANRANAQHSTGPKSPESKAKTRLNAKRDGITGQVITLSDEDSPVFDLLQSELIADLVPETIMELKLAKSIAWDTWRLDHLRAVEMNMYTLGKLNPETTPDCDNPVVRTALSDALTFEMQSPRFALMSIYEQRLNRVIHKNLDKLRELQAERKRNFQQDRDEEVVIARANDFKGLPYKVPESPSPNGFVFSSTEILAAANRRSVLENAKFTLRCKSHPIQFPGAGDEINPDRPNSGLKATVAA